MLNKILRSNHKGFTPLEIRESQSLSKNSKAKPPNGLALSTAKFNGKFLTGFTILEVLVAISVITIGVLATFNVVQNITLFSFVIFILDSSS